MKIEIFKKNNDENIYIRYNSEEKVLNFDSLKDLSKLVLDNKVEEANVEYEVEAIGELSLYKNTVDDIIKNINEDTELFNLYKESVSDPVESEEQNT